MTILKPLKIHFVVDMSPESWALSPHLGVSCLSAFLKENIPGIRVTLSCMTEDVAGAVEREKPDVIGFSCTSRHFTQFEVLAGELKAKFGIPIVFGGVHISIAPNELPRSADVGVVGEGERTLLELMQDYSAGGFPGLGDIMGIVYRKDEELVINRARQHIEQLDSLPPRDLTLRKLLWNRNIRAVMVTSRGCPYKCSFCASSVFWDRARLHSPKHVVQEMKLLSERFGVQEILINDDFFSINKKRVAEIADIKQKDPLLRKIRVECLSRVDNFDEEMASLFEKMGVYRVSFGMESGCQKTLDYLKNKKVTLEQVSEAVRTAKRYGLECVGSFIIGAPYETAEDIRATFSFIRGLGLRSVQITVATPFPGTALWADGRALGKIDGDKWSEDYYTMFVIKPDSDMRSLLEGKRLLTQIDRGTFIELAEEAAGIENRINFRWMPFLKEKLREFLLAYGLGFLLKWRRRLLRENRA